MKQPGTALNSNAACFPVEVEQPPLRHFRQRHLRGKRQTLPESGYQDRFLPCRSVHFQSLILFSVIDIFWLKENNLAYNLIEKIYSGLHHPLDGITNPEYKLLRFIQLTNFLQTEEGTSF
jgi:hypothetical protein